VVIDKILAHLDKKAALHEPVLLPQRLTNAASQQLVTNHDDICPQTNKIAVYLQPSP
jgi:hypothetical protein